MKKNQLILAALALVILAFGAWYFFAKDSSDSVSNGEPLGEPAVVITRTDAGYEPKEVTVKKGDIVTWKNATSEFHWPASDLHPTHGVYPEFDPLRPIASGEEWSFRFDQAGEWKYHDHIRANKTGVVTVTN